MKKVWLIMLSIILAAGFVFIGCNGDPDDDKPPIDDKPGDDYPEFPGTLPGGLTLPAGAIWLGEEDEVDPPNPTQMRWTIGDELKAKIYSGELNRFLVYVDASKISDEYNNVGLSSVQFAMNGPPEPTWRQQGTPYGFTSRIAPEEIDGPFIYYLNHTERFDEMERNGWLQLFIQHGASGGALHNLNLVAVFLAPGLPGDPEPPEDGPPGQISIKLGATTVSNITVTGSRGDVTSLADNNGYEFAANNTGGHRGKYAQFPVNLGDKKLSDYEAITFTYQVADDYNRRIVLVASDTAFSGNVGGAPTHSTGGSGSLTTGSDFGLLAANQITLPMGNTVADATGTTPGGSINPKDEAVDVILPFDFSYYPALADLTGIVHFSIYEHTEQDAVYRVSNIVFVEREASDDADVAVAKTAIENATYTVLQSNALTEAQAKTAVETIISELPLYGVTTAVVDGAFTAATAGTEDKPNGTNGTYTFTVNLSKGEGTPATTKELTLTITAMEYIPEGGQVVFTLADFVEEYYGTIFSQTDGTQNREERVWTELNRLTNHSNAHPPLVLNSGDPTSNKAYIKENGLELFVGGSGQGINIRTTGSNSLDLTPDRNVYEIIVTGSVTTFVSAGAIRLNNSPGIIATSDITEVGQMFELIGEIPSSGEFVDFTRITTDGGAVGNTFFIESIEIKNKGPRDQIGTATINLTVSDKGAGLDIVGGIPEARPGISKNSDTKTLTFTVGTPVNGYVYTWYVNGTPFTGNSITVNAADYDSGDHSVLLTVKDDKGIIWSLPTMLGFRVTN